MTDLRTAAQQALEALERPNAGLVPHNGEWMSIQSIAIDALRVALEADDSMYGAKALTKAYENGWNAALAQEQTPEECITILLQRMSISALARAIGVDPSAISHAVAGRSRITHYAAVDKLRSMV